MYNKGLISQPNKQTESEISMAFEIYVVKTMEKMIEIRIMIGLDVRIYCYHNQRLQSPNFSTLELISKNEWNVTSSIFLQHPMMNELRRSHSL